MVKSLSFPLSSVQVFCFAIFICNFLLLLLLFQFTIQPEPNLIIPTPLDQLSNYLWVGTLQIVTICFLIKCVVVVIAECLGLNLSVKLKRLINLQKRVIRIISRSSFHAHANPIFVSLRIVKFEGTIKPQIGKVMYLNKNGLLPGSFNDMFLLNCDVHSYNTRSKNAFHLPYCRANVRKM